MYKDVRSLVILIFMGPVCGYCQVFIFACLNQNTSRNVLGALSRSGPMAPLHTSLQIARQAERTGYNLEDLALITDSCVAAYCGHTLVSRDLCCILSIASLPESRRKRKLSDNSTMESARPYQSYGLRDGIPVRLFSSPPPSSHSGFS